MDILHKSVVKKLLITSALIIWTVGLALSVAIKILIAVKNGKKIKEKIIGVYSGISIGKKINVVIRS